MTRIIKIVSFLLLGILMSSDVERLTRISVFNFGLDYTDFTNSNELYRSISIVPLMVEREVKLDSRYVQKFGIGLYLTPFFKEEYDEYGNYIYGDLVDGYFANIRIRYIQSFNDRIDWFVDFAHGDEEIFEWSPARITWMELGAHYQINYSSRLLFGYKRMLDTDGDVDMNSLFINFIFGHSFLRR